MRTLERPTKTSQKISPPTAPTGGPGGILMLIGLLVLLGISASAAGVMMILDPTGADLNLSIDALDGVPLVSDYRIPGILLTLLMGVLPLLWVVGLITRARVPLFEPAERRIGLRWPLVASFAQGVGVIVWIVLQYLWLPETTAIQAVTLGVGALIAVFSVLPSVRSRYRAG